MMASEQFPRFASDGAGGVTNLGKNPAFETDSNKIIKLPNGKFVTSCEAVQRIDTNSPFFNKTDYDTGQANLELGGEYAIQFFDPTKMP